LDARRSGSSGLIDITAILLTAEVHRLRTTASRFRDISSASRRRAAHTTIGAVALGDGRATCANDVLITARLLELDELGAHLIAREALVGRLGESGQRGGAGCGDNNGLNQRLHDVTSGIV
jgi:hypothetical protein